VEKLKKTFWVLLLPLQQQQPIPPWRQLQSIRRGNIIVSAASQQYEVSSLSDLLCFIFPLFFANILSHLLVYTLGTILIAAFGATLSS
jgi:hypothetical protein